jgi:ADP-ribose pyrophosphatase YjhB (NUDIX family)
MAELILSHENNWKGELYRFEIYAATDFSDLTGVSQVYGLVLNASNKILIVSGDQKNWILPGGGVEEGEALIDTLKREVYEEAAVAVDDQTIQPFFFQKVYSQQGGEWKHLDTQARFVCRVGRQDEFVSDPDNEDIKYQLFIDIGELDQYLDWGETVKFIKNEILRAAI